ncbi:MAG: CHAD domain-containing protein [Rhodobacteraceae bacterium]|nr:CHAD domain-containing protein [Paracoccaceae bacterium]
MKLAYPADRPKLLPALQRVLGARARMACAEVAAHGPNASVFELRKRSKELRGLLRLLRGGWDAAPDWHGAIRDAAAKLAPARDAEVMLATFDSLTARRRTPSDFDSLRYALLDEIDLSDAALDPDAIAQFADMMAAFAQAVTEMEIRGKTAPSLWHNLARTWDKGHHAYAAACHATEDATAFHDWRKRLKQHWYQARFFKPIDPKTMRQHIAQVDGLARVLGAHNDLDVLDMYLRTTCPGDPALDRLALDLTALRNRHAQTALTLGAALYNQPNPAEDWAKVWQVWCKG